MGAVASDCRRFPADVTMRLRAYWTGLLPMTDDLKTISYRGGVVRFRIPADWVESYEADGGGEFYDDAPQSGTLRLNVLMFEQTGQGHLESAFAFLSRSAGQMSPGAAVIERADGNASLSYWRFAAENGEDLAIRCWQVANAVPPRHMRMAVFSYTLLKSQMSQPRFVAEVAMIDREVGMCEFAKEIGVVSTRGRDMNRLES